MYESYRRSVKLRNMGLSEEVRFLVFTRLLYASSENNKLILFLLDSEELTDHNSSLETFVFPSAKRERTQEDGQRIRWKDAAFELIVGDWSLKWNLWGSQSKMIIVIHRKI